MRKLILVLGVSVSGTLALATPTCVTATYTSYLTLSGGCVLGDATISNFTGLSFVNSPGVATLPTDDIQVVPAGTFLNPSLAFVYTDNLGNPTPLTFSINGEIFSFTFSYQLAPTNSNLASVQMDSTFANTTPGSVSATKNAQLLSGGTIFTSTVSDGGTSNALNTYPGTSTPVTGVGTWVISDTVSVQAQTGGSGTQAGFDNVFGLNGAADVPEPVTALLIGSGLICLGLITPRRRNSRLT